MGSPHACPHLSIRVALPTPGLAFTQLVVSICDWVLAGAVLYALLPGTAPPLLSFLGAFLLSQLLGLASHVPGGIGVFEGLMILLLAPYVPSSALLPALIVYRAIYYLLPLGVALVVLVADELSQRRAQAARVGAAFDWLTEQLTPHVLAVFTFLAGVVLLFSGATPAAAGRLAFSIECCRSRSSKLRISSAASRARRCCFCRRDSRGVWMVRGC
jgi:phosphatidylglycerol lysyltransferase